MLQNSNAEVRESMPIKCPHCGTENLDGALFCDECGASLTEVSAQPSAEAAPAEAAPPETASEAAPAEVAPPVVGALKCPSCGHENPPDARYCESCGAPLAAPSVFQHLPQRVLKRHLSHHPSLRLQPSSSPKLEPSCPLTFQKVRSSSGGQTQLAEFSPMLT